MHTFKAKNPYFRRLLKWLANVLTPACHDYRGWGIKNKIMRLAGLDIGNHVAIDHGFLCLTGQEEYIHIGDYSAIGVGVKIWNFNEVQIGKFCMFAADVTLVNGGHDKNSLEPFSGPLVIGNGCWIGNGARIVGPLSVGDNVIIGAGSVVIKDVPPNSIIAGVPAKIIGMRELPDRVWHLGGDYFSPHTFERQI
ncbi:MAG: acyltransferase [Thiobacillus sp.]|nr:acyltransferase [Thiobacillus sp.]